MTQVSGAVLFGSTLLDEPVQTTLEPRGRAATDAEFNTLVENYSDRGFHVALRILHNAHDAEDAVQEAFISAYRAFPNFKGQSKASTWLYRIVVNTCLLKIRKEKTRTKYIAQVGYEDSLVGDWHANPEQAFMDVEMKEVLEEGLGNLAPHLRTAVVLRDVQGFSTDEAAQILDTTVPALKSRLHRGRILRRSYIEGYLGKPADQQKK